MNTLQRGDATEAARRSRVQLAADYEIGRWTPEQLRAVLDSMDTYYRW
jgi:hypothetical protein